MYPFLVFRLENYNLATLFKLVHSYKELRNSLLSFFKNPLPFSLVDWLPNMIVIPN